MKNSSKTLLNFVLRSLYSLFYNMVSSRGWTIKSKSKTIFLGARPRLRLAFCSLLLLVVPFKILYAGAPVVASKQYVDSGFAQKASALANYIAVAQKGAVNGVASLDGTGKVPSSQLPTIPAAQIQSDWGQVTSSAVDYIKNKPAIGTTSGTIAAGDDARFRALPDTAPIGNPPAGLVYVWFE